MPIRPKIHQPHYKKSRAKKHGQRKDSTARGYNYQWSKARLSFLKEHAVCVRCEKKGRTEASTVVDHIIPHRGDMVLFWLVSNWQALCKTCHDYKTLQEKQ